MSTLKLITVFGATGSQGNAVAKALIERQYKVRAVTRNSDNPKAKELQALGADITQVKSMDDTTELEKAIQGSYGVFAVTNFWGLVAENAETAFDREIAQGKAIGDISKRFGVKHLVYSGLEYVKEIYGKPCPHLDSKGIVEKYLDKIGVPYTSTRYPFYYDNFVGLSMAQKHDDGSFSINLAMKNPIHAVAAADGGPAVASVFDQPEEYIGKKVGFSGDKISAPEMAAVIEKVTGKTVKFNYVPPDVFATFPFPGADELAIMFEFFDNVGVDRSIELTRKLNPDVSTFEQWAQKNKDVLLA